MPRTKRGHAKSGKHEIALAFAQRENTESGEPPLPETGIGTRIDQDTAELLTTTPAWGGIE
jgi:hypothetical protein